MATTATPSLADFRKLAKKHTLVPVYRTVTADLETPVSAFLRIAAAEPEAFLLESVEGGERIGRYTFIGIRPYKKIVATGQEIVITEGKRLRKITGDIFAELKQALTEHKPAHINGLPPFTAGAVGYFAYDVVRQIERLPETAADELGVPDAYLMFFDEVLAFDHVRKEIFLIITADLKRNTAVDTAYNVAIRRLNSLERRLASDLPRPKARKPLGRLEVINRTPRKQFLSAVQDVKEYIAAGDIFQCVLSQRFDCIPGVDAFDIYRSLRIVNPSPYMYFLRFPLERASSAAPARAGSSRTKAVSKTTTAHVVGASPEMLVRVKNGIVEYHPIAGTRPRGDTPEHDAELEASLREDAKEIAEHVMLVDLGRNDLGRVSEYGSVKVKDLMFVERYSHVMHLSSALESKLRPDLNPVDAFRACFPAGTLSGAPKVRAMEVIEELEPARRGVYGGSIFYADFSGNLDSCIAIRTLFMDGPNGHIQSGAGLVADSVPESEYQECINKSKAVIRAIERARNM